MAQFSNHGIILYILYLSIFLHFFLGLPSFLLFIFLCLVFSSHSLFIDLSPFLHFISLLSSFYTSQIIHLSLFYIYSLLFYFLSLPLLFLSINFLSVFSSTFRIHSKSFTTASVTRYSSLNEGSR